MARRVEYQVRSDWQYLGGLWNLLFKTLVNHAPSLSFQFSSTAGGVGDADAESVGSAAVSLSKKLWHGEYTTIAGRRKPISGDITKLGYAVGLSPTERNILNNFHYMSDRVPSTREIRREIGHIVFSAMIFYGHPLFLTISPSERHSGLTLHLSRFRRGDPGIINDEDQMADWVGERRPALDQSATADLPAYTVRRAITSRDPLAVIEGFDVTIRVLLPILLGMRMCPMCPKCNANGASTPCQDKFGSNAEPCGGIHGRADALVGAVEYQSSTGSPHFHADIFLQQAHQHKTMEEIGAMMQANLLHVDTIKEYQSYINDECYVDQKQHNAERSTLEASGPVYGGDSRLATMPNYVLHDDSPDLYNHEDQAALAHAADQCANVKQQFNSLFVSQHLNKQHKVQLAI